MSINYTTYVAQIANLMVQQTTDPNFQTMLPGMIEYAENRIYREMDLLVTRIVDASTTVSSGVRNFTLPTTTGIYDVVEQINLWSPAGATSSNATRVALTPATKEYLDFAWPTSTATGVPIYFAPISNTTYAFGPPPDAAYTAEVIGTQTPAPLSTSNSSTFLTQFLSDLFIAASMVFASGYMRNYGSQADDPQMPGSWETQYKTLFMSADEQELRRRYQSQGWTTMSVNKIATPPRT